MATAADGSKRPGAHAHAGPGLWIGLALGVPIIGWGIRGILADSDDTHPAELGRWIVGSAVVHDALAVPLVLAVAVVARRIVPRSAWPGTRWALATTAVLTVVAWPFVRGYGRSAGNPSLLPRNYAIGLATTVALVWTAGFMLAAVARTRAGRAMGRSDDVQPPSDARHP